MHKLYIEETKSRKKRVFGLFLSMFELCFVNTRRIIIRRSYRLPFRGEFRGIKQCKKERKKERIKQRGMKNSDRELRQRKEKESEGVTLEVHVLTEHLVTEPFV